MPPGKTSKPVASLSIQMSMESEAGEKWNEARGGKGTRASVGNEKRNNGKKKEATRSLFFATPSTAVVSYS